VRVFFGVIVGLLLATSGCGPAEPTAVRLNFYFDPTLNARQVTVKVISGGPEQPPYAFPAMASGVLPNPSSVGIIFNDGDGGKTVTIEASVTDGTSIEPLATRTVTVKLKEHEVVNETVCFGLLCADGGGIDAGAFP
jgi:hypothetical protein